MADDRSGVVHERDRQEGPHHQSQLAGESDTSDHHRYNNSNNNGTKHDETPRRKPDPEHSGDSKLVEQEREVADYDVRAGGHPIIEVDPLQSGSRSPSQSPDGDNMRSLQSGDETIARRQEKSETEAETEMEMDNGIGGTVSPCHSSDRTAVVDFSPPSPSPNASAEPEEGSRYMTASKEKESEKTAGHRYSGDELGNEGVSIPRHVQGQMDGTRTPGRSVYRDIDGFRYTVDYSYELDGLTEPAETDANVNADANPEAHPTIWVDFSPSSPSDPLHFPSFKKYLITTIACAFTFWTSLNASSYAIGEGSMERDLGASRVAAASGLSLYAWGFAVFPMVLAPFSEELGRRPLYVVAGVLYWVFYFAVARANSIAVVLVFRFLQGGAGSVGSTLVGGTLADIWPASERGGKMAVFALMAVSGTAFAPVIFSWVEANPSLEWRWIQWIQIILVGVYLPSIPLFMPETRAAVLLKKQAEKMRKKKRGEEEGGGEKGIVGMVGGWDQGMKYLARGEVGKPKLTELIRVSLVRPIHLLATEPIVIFFTLWISIAWAVMYGLVQSIPYVFREVYGFGTGRVGLVYLALTIGGFIGYALNFVQEHYYNTRVGKKGAEARLYGAMVAGIALACGCFIYAWTTFSHITYVAPCIGIVIIMAGVYTIYLACFNYLADGYSLYASSALAGQSLVRNLVGGSFPMFANPMYENLNPNWASTLFGLIAALLAAVPFVGFFYGPQIRAKSKFSKLLLEEEKKAAQEKEGQDDMADPA